MLQAKRPAEVQAAPNRQTEVVPMDFEQFERENRAPLTAVAVSITLEREAADDLVQETFLSVWRAWDTVGGLDRPDLWARRVLVNRGIDHRRRNGRWSRVLQKVRRGSTFRDGLGDTVSFWEAVHQLAPRQQQVVVLRALEEYSIDEIAETLEIAPGTVKATLHQARLRLTELLIVDQTAKEK